MTIDVRPTRAAPDDDPYLWLEEIDGVRATAWADESSDKTRTAFLTDAALDDRDTLAALWDRPDKIVTVARYGGSHVYNFWQDKQHPRGLLRRTTLEDFRTATPTWDVVLDVDALAKAEGEDWVYQGSIRLPDTYDRAILRLSRGGSDACVMREFDFVSRRFVADGFNLPEAKGQADWWDRDTLVVATALGGDAAVTSSGYARTVRFWKRGTPFEQSRVLFEVDRAAMSAGFFIERTLAAPSLWFVDRTGFFDAWFHRGDLDGHATKLDLPSDVVPELHRGWLFIKPRKAWSIGGATVQPGQLIVFSLAEFERGGRAFTTLFTPTDRCVLDGWTVAEGKITLSIQDNLKPRFEVYASENGSWVKSELIGLPRHGVVSVWRLDVHEHASNGDLLAMSYDPLTPPTLSLIERGVSAPIILKQAPKNFNADRHAVTQFEAIAADGERIPYTVVGPAGAPTGDAPVHMVGYGGFEVPQQAHYNTAIGKLWLERGGTSVITNIRGGGEFGTRWHNAGIREKKITSHDDFAAIAADLVARGITQPKRIAAEGGSNGGILISNMLTRYPGRFGALFCTIPLIDMRRYSKLLAGASWIAEYGDPDKPEDWAYLQNYSAYHMAEPGHAYPPILIATTRKDDRVHPAHARKFAAKLQAMGYADARYFEIPTGGHGYGKDAKERATFSTLGLTFLARSIGWTWPGHAANLGL
jgi:prolyl oligopeptidase